MSEPMSDMQILALWDRVVTRHLHAALDDAEWLGLTIDRPVRLAVDVKPGDEVTEGKPYCHVWIDTRRAD